MMRGLANWLKGKDLLFVLLVVVLLFAIIGFGAYSLVTGRKLDGITLIVGQLISAFTLMLNYRYGSSKGSKDKSELLNQKDEKLNS